MYYSDVGKSLIKDFKKFIKSSKTIYIVSPFITKEAFKEFELELNDFINKGGFIYVITSTFSETMESFNYKDLFEINNKYKGSIKIKVQVVKKNELPIHKKLYCFENENSYEVFNGSSNFTLRGLSGKESSILLLEGQKEDAYKDIKYMLNNNGDYDLIDFDELDIKDLIIWERDYFIKDKIIQSDLKDYVLFDFQQEIIDRYNVDKLDHKNHSVILPTGTGKTVVAVFMYMNFIKSFKNSKMLFTTHRIEILKNAHDKFKEIIENYDCLYITSENVNNYTFDDFRDKNIFITNRLLKNMILKNIFKADNFDIIFYDEAHHYDNESETNTFDFIYKYFKPKNNIALTATPERRDGISDITKVFNNVLYKMELYEAIEKRLVSDIKYILIKDKSNITINESDLKDEIRLILKADNDIRNNLVVESIKNYIDENSTSLIFCINIDHAKKINSLLTENGYISDFLVSGDNNRHEKINRFRNKDLNFLCVVDIFNEGIDIPEISNVIFLRPTKSKTIYLQQLGRGLRKKDNKVLKVIDIATNINIKNYWLDRLNNVFDSFQLTELIENDVRKFKGISIEFENLCEEELLSKLKEQHNYIVSKEIKNFIAWDLVCFNKKNNKKIIFTLIMDKNKNNWYELYRNNESDIEIVDIHKLELDIEYKYPGLNFKGFDIIKFLKITKINNPTISDFIKNNIKNIINVSKKSKLNLPYNFGLKKFPSAKIIKPQTILFKRFKDGKKAFVRKDDNGYTLIKGSHILPYSRNIENTLPKVIKIWESLGINKDYNKHWVLEDDLFFESSGVLSDVIVGGNSSFPNEMFIEKLNIKLRDFYIKNMCKIIDES
ncbi:DEAD/DEAH box helicase family protein [Spiroplasma turonicum]|uniref:DEAD/DEAH family helicase n=1 Tax=Spiroplasma turonicum TaxID=216946 RepID=A0A0K1P6C2_9MOLU|nr:DEAD/DEAH box helicase family protein [Spiroplasma turonicum]AKU79825.1 DEAD/DEAH family helicase [Spiroplasma turonicum]ALX70840.1 ATP-dependent helicase IRC3 [Spiroplasma turonicum]